MCSISNNRKSKFNLFTLNQSKVLVTTFLILFKPMKYMFKHYDDDLKK